MRDQKRHSREVAARAAAARHHGAISRRQLLRLGFTPKAIKHQVGAGWLFPVFRGVYALGREELGQDGWFAAAVLATDAERAAICHESAATMYTIGRGKLLRPIHVSVPGDGGRRERQGIVIHRRRAPFEVTEQRGIRVTSPECTIIDMAAMQSRDETETMISQAVIRRLTTEARLREAAGAAGRRPGAGPLRRIMDIRTFRFTRSGLERAFIPIALRAGLGMPLTNQVVHGYEVDFYFAELGLIVEVDGFTYHQTAAQRARDLERDQTLTALGLTCCRFSDGQIRFEPARVELVLAELAAQLHAERRRHALRAPP